MATPRFLITSDYFKHNKSSGHLAPSDLAKPGTEFQLNDKDFHHLKHVLRLKPGDKLKLVIQDLSSEFLAEIQSIELKFAKVSIKKKIRQISSQPLTLILGVPKASTCDFIIEKAVELGVKRVGLFSAERSQGPLRKTQLERFHRIALSAVKQSGGYLPTLTEYAEIRTCLSSLLNSENKITSKRYLLSPDSQNTLWQAIQTLYTKQNQILKGATSETANSCLERKGFLADYYLIAGPEGGLTLAEEQVAERFGFIKVGLGDNILKTETAVIAACTLLNMANA